MHTHTGRVRLALEVNCSKYCLEAWVKGCCYLNNAGPILSATTSTRALLLTETVPAQFNEHMQLPITRQIRQLLLRKFAHPTSQSPVKARACLALQAGKITVHTIAKWFHDVGGFSSLYCFDHHRKARRLFSTVACDLADRHPPEHSECYSTVAEPSDGNPREPFSLNFRVCRIRERCIGRSRDTALPSLYSCW